MADPVTISMGVTAAASAVGAAGQLYSGQAGAAAANYQAGIAQMNAQIAQQNAAFESAKGEVEAQQAGMKGRYQIGEMKATQAASGVDVNRGSTVLARDSAQDITSLNEASIRNNAARKAWGFEVESAGDEANAALDRMKASTTKTASEFGAASSILGGASSVAGQWATASMKGGYTGPKIGGYDMSSIGNIFGFGSDSNKEWSGAVGGDYDA